MLTVAEYFENYFRDFSTKDLDEFYQQYFHEDAVFNNPQGPFTGQAEVVGFWREGHPGIREKIYETYSIIDEENRKMAAEVHCEWHCYEDTYYLGERKKGHVYTMDTGVFYHLEGDKMKRVNIYYYTVPKE